jgi:hypothetical protein
MRVELAARGIANSIQAIPSCLILYGKALFMTFEFIAMVAPYPPAQRLQRRGPTVKRRKRFPRQFDRL